MIDHARGFAARVAVAALSLTLAACADREATPGTSTRPPPAQPETTWVEIAGERFELEVALDPGTRYRGLSGRTGIPKNGGMLFVSRRPGPLAMVMRDCPEPLDVAFLDASGRVVAIHEMKPEPPRSLSESPRDYEARLPSYESGEPALFAIETAGGRLAEVGLAVGDRVVLDARALAARAR